MRSEAPIQAPLKGGMGAWERASARRGNACGIGIQGAWGRRGSLFAYEDSCVRACARTHAHARSFKLPILPILPNGNNKYMKTLMLIVWGGCGAPSIKLPVILPRRRIRTLRANCP